MWTAGFWGLVAGSALLVGALVGFYLQVNQRMIAAIMAVPTAKRPVVE